jgi:hypothetical protein
VPTASDMICQTEVTPEASVLTPFQANGSRARVISRLRVIPTFDRRHDNLSHPPISGHELSFLLAILVSFVRVAKDEDG